MVVKKKVAKKSVKKKIVKKKVTKKVVRKKAPVKKRVSRVSSHPKTKLIKKIPKRKYSSKMSLVLKNLFLFGVLFVLSLILYNATSVGMYEDLFFLLSMIFGFIEIAFLISLLVFVFLKYGQK